MKKTFLLEDLECACCAAQMEESVRRIEGVAFVSVNFITQKLTLEAPDEVFDGLMGKVKKAIRRIEPGVRVVA